MERLLITHSRLVRNVNMSFTRYLYKDINWDNRLIAIKGAKGVGKTTMLLQHIKRTFKTTPEALYVSADHIWFATHNILELAEYHSTHGGTHLFIDEIHRYKGWEREIKNIYDAYPHLHIVITGSSMLQIDHSIAADLSRRCRQYTLEGLSFREYLHLEGVAELPILSLDDILTSHISIAADITNHTKVLHHFENYLKCGFYPFYKETGDGFDSKLLQTIDLIIETEIPIVGNIGYDSIYNAKQLLGVLAEISPYTLNISKLTKVLSVSRNNLLKLLELMNKAALIRRLYATGVSMNMLTKPEKILFDNTNIMYALTSNVDSGTMRETYFASQMAVCHKLYMPELGDFVADDRYTFEVGGKKKGFKQISDLNNSYVVSDNIDVGYGNKIPLWLFGLMH